MKKTLCLLLLLSLLLGALPAHAASADSRAGVVATAYGSLNVRSSPSSSAAVVSALPKGSYVTLISRSGSWWRVEYAKGQYGYCHADYISTANGTASMVNVQYGSLNVRSGAGTSYAKAASLYNGEYVLVLFTANGWSRILYHGTKTGYVSAKYLSGGYSAVSLAVPDYKQTDSRWAKIKLGSSGKTMAQVGCATTAIAMMESCRTGSAVTPDVMAKRLSYTASGNVYWPSHFQATTDSTNYLSRLYAHLQSGRPVLFGAKTARGSQHWVVVTGFTGGSLSPARFTINDPGSSTRTTLAQLFDSHPYFYKYFVY